MPAVERRGAEPARKGWGMTYAGLAKTWATLLIAIFAATLLSTMALATGAEAQAVGCTGQVVLDPGHGGTDPGAENKAFDQGEGRLYEEVART